MRADEKGLRDGSKAGAHSWNMAGGSRNNQVPKASSLEKRRSLQFCESTAVFCRGALAWERPACVELDKVVLSG